jgi:hypothetical protein
VFTARYALSPYIKQICFVFKGLMYIDDCKLKTFNACCITPYDNENKRMWQIIPREKQIYYKLLAGQKMSPFHHTWLADSIHAPNQPNNQQTKHPLLLHNCTGSLLFLLKPCSLLLCLQDNFIPCVIQSFFLLFIHLHLTGKVAWKKLREKYTDMSWTHSILLFTNKSLGIIFSCSWKFVALSLFINLVLSFKCILTSVA